MSENETDFYESDLDQTYDPHEGKQLKHLVGEKKKETRQNQSDKPTTSKKVVEIKSTHVTCDNSKTVNG